MAPNFGIGLHYAISQLIVALYRFHAGLDRPTLPEIVENRGCESKSSSTEASQFVHLPCELFALVVSVSHPGLCLIPVVSEPFVQHLL